jgi:hypothetical protein
LGYYFAAVVVGRVVGFHTIKVNAMSSPPKKKWYVGCKQGNKTVFGATSTPTKVSHGHLYVAVVGPYQTRKEAYQKIALM